MKLTMSDSEIARRYRNSLDPKKAVKILAQLNATSPSDITAALARQGVILDPPSPARKKSKRLNQQEAKRLYDLGMNDHEIADRLGASHSGVYHWRYRNGLAANTGTGYHPQRKKEGCT
ncbi:MAG: hypothetical protein K2M42_05865 [Oscillospiraceae bacterium]|nr:hypothetical protein [Oscillospiraceae bacterium]